MARKSVSKGLRFSIFRRDGFTCGYCGRRPPEAVLVIDHVVPVIKGGTNDEENLVTSCFDCNAGKSDKDAGPDVPKPDRTMAILEAQQEIAEMQIAHEARLERQETVQKIVGELQDRWQDITEFDWCPADDQIAWLLNRYGYEVSFMALEDVARKIRDRRIKHWGNHWVPYLRAVARNMAQGD